MKQPELVFLKLGGSLITDKSKVMTARPAVIERIAREIALYIDENPSLDLVLGHGSGSFGHASADRYQTHTGGQGAAYWHGYAKVWGAARALNQIVIENLLNTGLQVIAFPPSAGIIANNQRVDSWDVQPLQAALSHKLIPVVQGDVVFDSQMGGTILSTEQIFRFLSSQLTPSRILLAGIEEGVYTDPNQPQDIIPNISPSNFAEVVSALSGANSADVTGGMLSKVQGMLSLVEEIPALRIQIFSGEKPGQIYQALRGEMIGTQISM